MHRNIPRTPEREKSPLQQHFSQFFLILDNPTPAAGAKTRSPRKLPHPSLSFASATCSCSCSCSTTSYLARSFPAPRSTRTTRSGALRPKPLVPAIMPRPRLGQDCGTCQGHRRALLHSAPGAGASAKVCLQRPAPGKRRWKRRAGRLCVQLTSLQRNSTWPALGLTSPGTHRRAAERRIRAARVEIPNALSPCQGGRQDVDIRGTGK